MKEIIESAFLLGRLQHEGKTVLIDRVHATTRKLTAKIGAPKCECRLNDLDAFQKGILRGAHVSMIVSLSALKGGNIGDGCRMGMSVGWE